MSETVPGTDRWRATALVDRPGAWEFRIEAWVDDWATWLHNAQLKIPAGVDVALMLRMGADLLARARRAAPKDKTLQAASAALTRRGSTPTDRLAAVTVDAVTDHVERYPLASLTTVSESAAAAGGAHPGGRRQLVRILPPIRGCTSEDKDGGWTSGTFRTASRRLPALAQLGFDVVYLPPIHPIGTSFRKGANNSLIAGPDDPGSPWAIGSAGRRPRRHPPRPRHRGRLPRLRRHGGGEQPGGRPRPRPAVLPGPSVGRASTRSGSATCRTAASPTPRTRRRSTRTSTRSTSTTTRSACARRCCASSGTGSASACASSGSTTRTRSHCRSGSGCCTRWRRSIRMSSSSPRRSPGPRCCSRSPSVGFQQSYTYFTWRNTKLELAEYLTELSHDTSDCLRPNLFVNTPDILTEYLQFGGPPGLQDPRRASPRPPRRAGACTPGYELYENVARPGIRGDHRQREVRVPAAGLRRRRTGRALARPVR